MAVQQAPQQSPSAKELVGHPELPQGALFGLPGVTYWSEQVETNDGVSLTLAQGTQTVFQFPNNWTNTDILFREVCEINIAQTTTAGTQTITPSPYFPYNFVGPVQINMQNQFNTYDLYSGGIDSKIFDLARPPVYQGDAPPNYWEQNPISNAYGSQQNLNSAANYTQTSPNINFNLYFPMGINFDRYFDLGPDGQLRDNLGPTRTFVSPQLMAGANRIVTPKITMNPAFAATFDNGPYNLTGPTTTPATFSGTCTTGWQRKVVYQPRSSSDTPMLWGWQYTRESKQYSLSGRSTAEILLPTTGQILMVWYRLFDPSAAPTGGVGAPININQITNVWLQYGSGLYKYQDTPKRAQRRFMLQHQNVLPPQGVLFHDLAIDEYNQYSNANALNTLDTSACKVHFDFTTTLSNTAYVVIGVEALRYVVQQ